MHILSEIWYPSKDNSMYNHSFRLCILESHWFYVRGSKINNVETSLTLKGHPIYRQVSLTHNAKSKIAIINYIVLVF